MTDLLFSFAPKLYREDVRSLDKERLERTLETLSRVQGDIETSFEIREVPRSEIEELL